MRALERQLLDGLQALREDRLVGLEGTSDAVAAPGPPSVPSQIIRAGSFIIDRERHVAMLGDISLELTPAQFEILACLAERAPAVISPQELTRRALNYDANDIEASDLMRWHVHHLRRKLEVDPNQPQMLKTIRGIGYKLDIA